MGRLFAVVFALFVVACGGLPDSRHAKVVTEPELAEAARDAIALWGASTGGDVSFRIADRCDSGDACARVSAIDGPITEWTGSSVQKPGSSEPGWVTVHIARWTLADPYVSTLVLAHELGHVLFLGHVDDDGDLMNANPAGCITDAALSHYNTEWGTNLVGGACLGSENQIEPHQD